MKVLLLILTLLSCISLTAQEGQTQSEIEMIESGFDYSDYFRVKKCDHEWVWILSNTTVQKCTKCGKSPIGVAASEETKYELAIAWSDTSQPHRPFTWIVDSSDLGIAEIRKAKNGEYYTIHRAFNGEAMMVSETVKNKAHLIDISIRYYPNFMIVDNTHLKPKRVKYNIILE